MHNIIAWIKREVNPRYHEESDKTDLVFWRWVFPIQINTDHHVVLYSCATSVDIPPGVGISLSKKNLLRNKKQFRCIICFTLGTCFQLFCA